MAEREPHRVLILGIGNILLQDEGLGVRAVERLQARCKLPEGVQAVDGGVMGLNLLPYLAGKTHVLVIDAVRRNAAPGTLVRLEGAEIPRLAFPKMSLHQIGLQELLLTAQLQGTLPHHVVLWGMEPDSVGPGLDLSPLVAGRLDDLVEAVCEELRRWGVEVRAGEEAASGQPVGRGRERWRGIQGRDVP